MLASLTKGGIERRHEIPGEEYAKKGIRVNAVAPGVTEPMACA